ncbi:MAG: MFS transporter [Proteobacteria bacterium]|nr:MFS transporter [Pseudomonadota bacterium]MBI3497349.1 MFS transporter [Pseudomonadota bacterium]
MSQTILSSPARSLSRATMLLVVTGAILSISTGLRQSFGLFLPPLLSLGVSASAFSFAIALQSIVWGLSQPLIGMLADRYGTRPVLMGSALIYGVGLLVMSLSANPLTLDLGGGLLAGLGVAGTGLGVVMGAVSRSVEPSRRSQAVGAVAAVGSLGTFLLAPLGQWLIADFGWQAALVVSAGIAGAMAVLGLAIGPDQRPETTAASRVEDEQDLGTVLRAAARHPGYLAMTAAFFACGFQLMFITVHLPSYLALCGISPGVGASALGVIGLCNAVGSYVVGQLGARYSQKRLLALIYLFRTLAIIVFLALPISPASTLIFAGVMGFLWLSVSPLVSGLVDKVFGLKHFGTLYGFVFLSHQVGSFCGVLLGGITFDLSGSYGWAWVWLIAIGILAFLLQWPMDDRPPSERARDDRMRLRPAVESVR